MPGESDLRTSSSYKEDLARSIETGATYRGVKGPSTIHKVLRIPEDVCFDYMHQVRLHFLTQALLCT